MTTDHLRHWAAAKPQATALVDDRGPDDIEVLSWAELDRLVNRAANTIIDAGIAPGEAVLWCGPNTRWALVAAHAARISGTVLVALPYKLTEPEAAYIVEHSESKAAIWVHDSYGHLVGTTLPRLTIGHNDVAPDPARIDESTRMLQYTSGTTGLPKGALRAIGGSPGQFTGLLELLWGSTEQDHRYLTTGPLYHSGPMGFAMRAHLMGYPVITQPNFDAEDWMRCVHQHKATTTFCAPTPVRRITRLAAEVKDRYEVTSMRTMIANAAPWTMALKQAYLADFPADSLWEVYGSTELSVSAVLRPEDQLTKPGSCGQLAPGVEMALFDDAGHRITKPHTEGELYVKSAGVFKTYYKNDDEFMANHLDGWQTVGDIAYFDEDDYWYICDRKKDMIISGGVNVYPAEVENIIDSHPGVAEVAVIGIADEEWGEAVHAVIVAADPTSPPDPDQLRTWTRERLAGFKVPKSVSFVEELPKTGSGKVRKRDLRPA